MSVREAQRVGTPPRALVLVRNTVTHDNRVLREVETLRMAGFAVLVAGVVSVEEPARRARVGDTEVVRIEPLTRRKRGAHRAHPAPAVAHPAPAGAHPAPAAASQATAAAPQTPPEPTPGRPAPAGRRPSARTILWRLTVTASYNLRGAALCRRTRPALVHANDYNTMWIALAAKLLCRSRVVYDSHELWADRNGRPEWRPWLIACEALFVHAADAVITASPGYADALARRYRIPRPVVVRNIPAGPSVTAAPVQAGGPGSEPPAGRPLADAPLAVYIGGLMPGRGLEPGIEALAGVPGLRMALVGPGPAGYRRRLLAQAQRAGVADRVEVRAAVAPEDVLTAVRGASFGLMLIEPVCRSYELTLPNKLFEYAAAGVPMLAADLPVIGALIRRHDLGEVVTPGDTGQVAAAMRRLLEPDHNRQLRERVTAFAAANSWPRERDGLQAVYAGAMGVR